jgi:hypothetical protein
MTEKGKIIPWQNNFQKKHFAINCFACIPIHGKD